MWGLLWRREILAFWFCVTTWRQAVRHLPYESLWKNGPLFQKIEMNPTFSVPFYKLFSTSSCCVYWIRSTLENEFILTVWRCASRSSLDSEQTMWSHSEGSPLSAAQGQVRPQAAHWWHPSPGEGSGWPQAAPGNRRAHPRRILNFSHFWGFKKLYFSFFVRFLTSFGWIH